MARTLAQILTTTANLLQALTDARWKTILVEILVFPTFVLFSQLIASALEPGDEAGLNNKIGLILGVGACGRTQLFIAREAGSLRLLVRSLATHAEMSEQDPNRNKHLKRTVKLIKTGVVVIAVYMSLIIMEMAVKPLILLRPAFRPTPQPESFEGLVLLIAAQSLMFSLIVPPYYVVLALHLCTSVSGTALMRWSVQRLRSARGQQEIHCAVKLHSSITSVVAELEEGYANVLVTIAGFVASMSLIGTFGVAKGWNDLMVTMPLLLWLLVLALIGDGLHEASVGASDAVYFGSWITEDVRSRKLLLSIMLRSRRPAGVRVRGLGCITPSGFIQIAKTWYSYLMMALSVH